MPRVLITGLSGVGKSTLLAELAARGHRCVDTDYGDYYETVAGELRWREDRIAALLATEGTLFVSGAAPNQGRFYDRLHAVVLLSAPRELLVTRLTTRTNNPYGRDPAQLAQTLEYVDTVEPLLRAGATLEIVTTVPVAEVADRVLAHVAAPPKR